MYYKMLDNAENLQRGQKNRQGGNMTRTNLDHTVDGLCGDPTAWSDSTQLIPLKAPNSTFAAPSNQVPCSLPHRKEGYGPCF